MDAHSVRDAWAHIQLKGQQIYCFHSHGHILRGEMVNGRGTLFKSLSLSLALPSLPLLLSPSLQL